MRCWCIVVLACACGRAEQPRTAVIERSVGVPLDASAPEQDAGIGAEIEAAMAAWDRHNNEHHIDPLIAMYAPTVRFFGVELSRAACKERLATYLAKEPELVQTSSDFTVSEQRDGWLVKFTKKMILHGTPQSFPSYVHFVRIDGRLVIDQESDTITDRNLESGCEKTLDAFARAMDAAFPHPEMGSTVVEMPKTSKAHYRVTIHRGHGYIRDFDFDPVTHVIREDDPFEGHGMRPIADLDPTTERMWMEKLASRCLP